MSAKHFHKSVLMSLACGLVIGIWSPLLAAGIDIYSGTFPIDELRWQKNPDGSSVPLLPDTNPIPQDGLPLLPGKSMNLLIPASFSVGNIEIIPLRTREIPLPGFLQLGTKMISSENLAVGQNIFPASDSSYPESWGAHGGVSYMRGFKLLSVNVFPLKVLKDAKGNWTRLEFLEEYTVRILPGNGTEAKDPAIRERLVPGERERTEKMIAKIIANPTALAGYARDNGIAVDTADNGFNPEKSPGLSGSAVRYLIITNDALAASFAPLADYRTSMGYPAVVRSIEWIRANYRNGADIQETMRMFIREAYQKWGVEYVLLGGDTDILPARYAFNAFYPGSVGSFVPVDMYFACLDGNWNADGDDIFGETGTSIFDPGDDSDMIREIMIGRATVSTATQVSDFTTKVIAYEAAPAGPGYANNFLFAAEELFYYPDGRVSLDGAFFAEAIRTQSVVPFSNMDYVMMYEAYDSLLIDSSFMYPGSVNETLAASIDSLNSGHFNVFNQIGHGYFYNMSMGDANLTVADASALTNNNYFLIYALNCASAAFDYSCLMERFLQNPSGGSFASIGAARAAFPFSAADFQEEFFLQMYQYRVQQLGDLISLSALPWVAQSYTFGYARWTLMNYTLLGDPASAIWLESPFVSEVAAPGSVGFGQQSIPVTVTSSGVPVNGATVTLRKGNSIYAMGLTDATGAVSLVVTVTEPGALDLTVSGLNLSVNKVTISIVPPTVYASLDSLQIVDDGTQGSIGNGNGIIESGETIALLGHYHDSGGAGAANLTSALSVSTSGVTILNALAAVGTLPAGGTVSATEYFLIAVDTNVVDGMEMAFNVIVTDLGSISNTNEISLNVMSPELETVSLDWEDLTYGNNDHVPGSGERIVIRAGIKNFGVGVVNTVSGYLRTNTPSNLAIFDSLVTYSGLGLLATSQGVGNFSMSIGDTSKIYDLRVDFVDDYGRSFSHSFIPSTPSVPVGLRIDNTQGPDQLVVSWDPDISGAARGYLVYSSQTMNGTYTRVNADIIDGVAFFRDENLLTLTTYYYKAVTIDTSLCVSNMSLQVHMSTAPPELGDFPLSIATETSSHNAVGDVDGDHLPEIVICADEIYVWNADGSELFDGDFDAQTLGPITDFNGGFTPMTPALVDLDGVPGVEIVAGNWNSQTLHIFKADGTELPGWPQSTSGSQVWMAPAIGDIDGDGALEIVVNNLSGMTLAWNIDGTEVADGDSNPATNGPLIIRSYEWGFSSPALFDVDGDGADEIIFGNNYGAAQENFMHAYNWDGTEAPGFPYSVGFGSVACSPTVADLDGNGIWEIIFVAENDSLHVVQQDGSNYPGFPILFVSNSLGNGGIAPSPAVGDFDQDGMLEIVAIEVFGASDSYIHVVDTDWAGGTSGQTLIGWPRYVPGNSEGSPLVGDLNGDGRLDILWGVGGSSAQVEDKLYAFTHDAQTVAGFPLSLGGPVRPTPVICDLDADHDVEIVYGGWDLQIHVWDMPFPYDGTKQPWGTFQGSNYRDGVHRRVSTTGVEERTVPLSFQLSPVYPNPFNPLTTIKMYIPGVAGGSRSLRVVVHDMRGRVVKTLFDGNAETGWQTWVWDGRDRYGQPQASGVYFLRASSGSWAEVRKMSLVK